MFIFMHFKCNQVTDFLFLLKYAQFWPPCIFYHVDINWKALVLYEIDMF